MDFKNVLNIRNLISSLEWFEPSKKVYASFEGYLLPLDNDYCSYRGDYSDLALQMSNNEGNTVKDVIDTLNKALDDKYMEGYKGGYFDIDGDTIVAVADYGYCGVYIVGVKEHSDYIELILGCYDEYDKEYFIDYIKNNVNFEYKEVVDHGNLFHRA